MIQAVLFDVDGTLVDSVDFHAQAWQDAFSWYGKEVPFGEIRKQIGKGGDQLLPVFFSDEEIKEFGDEMSKRRSEHYLKECMPRVQPFPRAHDLLRALADRGLRVALATSAKEEELEQLKKLIRADDVIHGQTNSDDVEKSKPHPDIFQAALQEVKASPEEALVIGDSPYDAEAAGKAGISTIGFLCGGFPAEDLTASGCVALYNSPSELLDQLDSSLIFSKTRNVGARLA